MSQRRDNFELIEAETGLKSMILRPLCAKHLEPTKAETDGLIDRDKLMEVTGRSRKPQIELAEELNMNDYPCPSGGCLLTDKIFSKKVRDLLDHNDALTLKDLQLLKAGRHFRYHGVKVVVGKDEADNQRLRSLVQKGDTLLEPVDFAGPSAIVVGKSENGATEFAAALITRYASDKAGKGAMLTVTRDGEVEEIAAPEAPDEELLQGANVC
jgi:hypothetical protein